MKFSNETISVKYRKRAVKLVEKAEKSWPISRVSDRTRIAGSVPAAGLSRQRQILALPRRQHPRSVLIACREYEAGE